MKIFGENGLCYDELRASFIVYFAVILHVIGFLVYELKDGDISFYIHNVGSVPNHQPLTFVILNSVNFFLRDNALSVAIVEVMSYVLLYSLVLIALNVIFGEEKYYYIAYFILMFLPDFIFYGTPLKQIIGLVIFFVFMSYFDKNKEVITDRKHLLIVVMFAFLAFLAHIIAFMFCLVLIGSFFLFKNRKMFVAVTVFAGSLVALFSCFRGFFEQTWYGNYFKLGYIFRINFSKIADNIVRLSSEFFFIVFVLVYVIVLVGVIINFRKINYVDVFVLAISTYFVFGAYNGDFFHRFMSLLPFVLVFGLSSVIKKIYDRKKGMENLKCKKGRVDVVGDQNLV